jgi:hypothetical protein
MAMTMNSFRRIALAHDLLPAAQPSTLAAKSPLPWPHLPAARKPDQPTPAPWQVTSHDEAGSRPSRIAG